MISVKLALLSPHKQVPVCENALYVSLAQGSHSDIVDRPLESASAILVFTAYKICYVKLACVKMWTT